MNQDKQGKFITLEGPDGSGKTTVMEHLADWLKEHHYAVVATREPGGSPIAEAIAEVILDHKYTQMDARTEALLFAASRRQHLVDCVRPALEAGTMVLCDRFVDSSIAYQGIARGLPVESIWQINQFAIQEQLPDLTLVLDVPASVGLGRIHAAKGSRQYDRLDNESLDFHTKVRQAFLDLAQATERMVVIDATQPLDQVVNDCVEVLKAYQIIEEDLS